MLSKQELYFTSTVANPGVSGPALQSNNNRPRWNIRQPLYSLESFVSNVLHDVVLHIKVMDRGTVGAHLILSTAAGTVDLGIPAPGDQSPVSKLKSRPKNRREPTLVCLRF